MNVRVAGAAVLLALPVLAGCGGNQNALHPEGHAERRIAHLWWVMLTGASVGFAVIVLLLLLGWVRRNRPGLPFGGGERAATQLLLFLGVCLPIATLTALFLWSDVFVIRSTAAPRAASTPGRRPMTIRVIGHQWFWEVRYDGTRAVTANEIHIPIRTRVHVVGTTDDVIHSFWIPELNRKVDLIPGRRNRVLLEADEPGVYRGQCSEFCGLQHAHMAVEVVAEPAARFRAWLAREAAPARATDSTKGKALFASEQCSGCHTIRGTDAAGKVGPDLTHLAGRRTLAALTIPNTREYLRLWIADPQHFKPGNKMPGLRLTNGQIDAIVSYLETLK